MYRAYCKVQVTVLEKNKKVKLNTLFYLKGHP